MYYERADMGDDLLEKMSSVAFHATTDPTYERTVA